MQCDSSQHRSSMFDECNLFHCCNSFKCRSNRFPKANSIALQKTEKAVSHLSPMIGLLASAGWFLLFACFANSRASLAKCDGLVVSVGSGVVCSLASLHCGDSSIEHLCRICGAATKSSSGETNCPFRPFFKRGRTHARVRAGVRVMCMYICMKYIYINIYPL